MPHAFDNLRELAQLDDAELRSRFNPRTVEIVVACSALLRRTALSSELLTPETLVSEVRCLESEVRSGSRALGEAIIRATDLGNAHGARAAKAVLAEFVASCEAPFYRRIAALRLNGLTNPDDA